MPLSPLHVDPDDKLSVRFLRFGELLQIMRDKIPNLGDTLIFSFQGKSPLTQAPPLRVVNEGEAVAASGINLISRWVMSYARGNGCEQSVGV